VGTIQAPSGGAETDAIPAVLFALHRNCSGEAHFIALNERVRDLCEIAPSEAYAARECFERRLHPDDAPGFFSTLTEAEAACSGWRCEYRVILDSGVTRWHELRAEPRVMSDGSTVWHGLIIDVTERKLREEQLSLDAVAFDSQQGFAITDAHGVILRVNDCFTEITGHPADQVIGRPGHAYLAEPLAEAEARHIEERVRATGHWHGELALRRIDDQAIPCQITVTAIHDRAERITHFIAAFLDISERKAAERRIHELAYYDPLTRLANRRLLMDRLAKAMANSRRSRQYGALLYLDLDNFKVLNDTLGHDRGDELLRAVADRLTGMVRDGDSVARLGGDEFVVLLCHLGADEQAATQYAEAIANKIRHALGQPYRMAGMRAGGYHGTASVGVCVFLDHTETQETLLKYADIALYQAKNAGRDTVCVYRQQASVPQPGRAGDSLDRADAWLTQAVRLMDQRMAMPPTVTELARELGTNVRKLTGLFRKRFGMTVTEYFAEQRLETACRLLAQCHQQIQIIGVRVGYRNAGDFTRAFRRRYGMSPRNYRRLHCRGGGKEA